MLLNEFAICVCEVNRKENTAQNTPGNIFMTGLVDDDFELMLQVCKSASMQKHIADAQSFTGCFQWVSRCAANSRSNSITSVRREIWAEGLAEATES